jgi:hypothetical protein
MYLYKALKVFRSIDQELINQTAVHAHPNVLLILGRRVEMYVRDQTWTHLCQQ